MSFNWHNFFRLLRLVLTQWDKTGLPMTPRRAVRHVAFFSLYPLYQMLNRLGFLLDDLLYSDWKRTPIKEPVFIIGNPRSGTTLLHRIMAQDNEHFFTFLTWELLFPAISQKKALRALGRMDRVTGGILERKVHKKESELFREFNKIHVIDLFAPEEDDKLLFHHCSFHGLAWLFPFEEIKRYHKFDLELPEEEKESILKFYEEMLRRQCYYAGGQRRLLSKNPASSLKIQGLLNRFPDCRFIYMIRHPLEVVPSTVNMAHAIWDRIVGVNQRTYMFLEGVYEIVRLIYEHPLKVLNVQPSNTYRCVRYEDLVRKPSSVVKELYHWLGLEISSAFDQTLKSEDEKVAKYVSQHSYSLEEMPIEPSRIVQDLHMVFERFGYDTKR